MEDLQVVLAALTVYVASSGKSGRLDNATNIVFPKMTGSNCDMKRKRCKGELLRKIERIEEKYCGKRKGFL